MANPIARTSQNTRRETFYQDSPFIVSHDSTESFIVRNASTGVAVFQVDASTGAAVSTGAMSLASLILTTAASKIVPGATSLSIRNNADTVTHFSITDSGVLVITPESASGTNVGSVQVGSTSQTQTVPDDTTTINLLCVRQNFSGATNGAVSNSARLVNGEAHWVDNTNDVATMAGGYFFAYNDSTSRDVQDLIGCIGRAYITSTGKSTVGMWGVRGDCNFTGAAASVVSAASVVGHQGDWSAAAVITTYSHFDAKSLNCSSGGASVVYGYGVNVQIPTNATSYNVGVNIGTSPVATGPYTIGLNVNTGGAWFRGNATLPVHADTTNTPCIIALIAGDNSAANTTNVLQYFYRGNVALGFFGFDTNVAQVAAGHTKLLSDLVIGSDKCLVDTNGAIWSANSINGNSMTIAPVVKTSGSVGTSFTYTGAAHTGLTPGNFAEFSFNAGRTVSFDASGTTIATGYTFNFIKPNYSSAAAMTMTEVATVRISAQPGAVSTAGFSPTLTCSWALLVAAGSSSFGGAIVQGHALNAINSTATASAAQAAGGYITSTSAATVTITLPTGTALGAALNATQGTIHHIHIDNTAGANVVTIAVNTNAVLSALAVANAASFGLLTVPTGPTGTARFTLVFSSATAYTFSRTA